METRSAHRRPQNHSRASLKQAVLCQSRDTRSRAVFVRGVDKGTKQRVRLKRLRLELRVKLAAQEERMVWKFDNLHVGCIRSCSGDAQSGAGQQGFIFPVEFVTMTMPFADLG